MQAPEGVRLRGQSEALTQRLNRLLHEYSDGLAVPKELIQNADDAGATEVTLIYDCRDHSSNSRSLLGDRMEGCQGCCMWAHNNASFTDNDFDNILRLSGATKEKVASKVGKFGLGFNAVYNLTDVPFLLSRSRMLILDPHGECPDEGFLEAVYSELGRRDTGVEFDFAKNPDMLQKYHDQFAPFKGVAGCELNSSFDGTLFRFPLRTAAQAERSRISDTSYTQQQMRSLLQLAAAQAEYLLLFTQSVKSLRFVHIAAGADPSEAQLLFSAEKQLQRYFSRHSLPVPPLPVTMSDEEQEFCQQTASLKAADAFLRMDSQQREKQEVSTQLTLLMCTEFGDVADEVIGSGFSSRSLTWLLCSRIGRGDSLKMSTERDDLVPVGGVAVLLSNSNDDPNQLTAQPLSSSTQPQSLLYCFLPLPVENPFPVMINGSFSLNSSRRNLNERTVDEKSDAWSLGDWNFALLEDTVCPAYLDAMQLLQRLQLSNLQQLQQQLWPLHHFTRQQVWQPLVKQFATKVLTDSSLDVFHTQQGWRSLAKSQLLHPEIRSLGDTSVTLAALATALLPNGEGLAEAGHQLRDTAELLSLNRCIVSRQWTGERLLLNILSNFRGLWQSHRQFCTEFLHFLLQMLLHSDTNVSTVSGVVTKAVQEKAKASACIPNSNNELQKAKQLLDPHCLAASLFAADAPQFPHRDFCSALHLQSMRMLGIRQEIEIEEVIERARSLAQLQDEEERKERCSILLQYIDNNLQRLEPGLMQLSSIPFLPAMQQQQQQLQWHSQRYDSMQLFPPNNLYSSLFSDIVCLNYLVMDSSVLSKVSRSRWSQLLRAIGVVCSVSEGAALQQVMRIRRVGCTNDEAQSLCSAVFDYLADIMSKNKNSKAWANNLISQAEHPDFVICNGQFANPKQISQNPQDVHAPPYLHVMPQNQFARGRRFLEAVGLRSYFTDQDFAEALQLMQRRYGDQLLSADDLQISLQLLECISKFKVQITNARFHVVAPDAAGILRPLEALCYNNVYWLQDEQPAQGKYFCHKNISRGLCEKLKMPTQREAMVAACCTHLPFGQHEELTTRLNNILSGYPFGVELFKELIQNADDAGATEIHFLCDLRQLPAERVFTENWSSLQGPALLVVNNSTFSEADIEGIQRLGEGSKRNDSWKTGQYGIGFNCVYNVTDVPSFLSDASVLCIMDPHCNFLSNATQVSPGGMFKDLHHQSKTRSTFADVFMGFAVEGVKQEGQTIFRLPLRTKEQANVSKICKKSLQPKDILDLFEIFKKELKQMLLFLNSVRKVTLSKVSDQGKTEQIFMAEATVENAEACQQFVTACSSAGHCQRQKKPLPSAKVTTRLQLQDSSGSDSAEQWCVSHMLQMPQYSNTPALNEELGKGDWRLLPRVGAAARVNGSDVIKQETGRVYCLLPLPLRSELQMVINGQFVLDPSRRELWQVDQSNRTDAKTEWNSLLLCDLLPQCMSELLLYIKNLISEDQLHQYYRLFPDATHMRDSWKDLARDFWQLVMRERLSLMPTLIAEQLQWLPLAASDAELDGNSCFLCTIDNERLNELLLSLQFPSLHCDAAVASTFFASLKASCDPNQFIPRLNSKILAKFLSGPVCNRNFASSLPQLVAHTPLKDAETVAFLIGSLLKDCTKKIAQQLLSNTPLQLNAADYLQKFLPNQRSTRLILSTHADLFPEDQAKQRFVHPTVTRKLSSDTKKICFEAELFVRFSLQILHSMLHEYKPDGVNPTDSTWFSRVWDFINKKAKQSKGDFKKAVAPINECKLLPVTQQWQDSSTEEHTATAVLPVSELGCVYHHPQDGNGELSNTNAGMHSVLLHLQVPILCSKHPLLQDNAAKLSNPASLLPLLHRHLNNLESDSLSVEQGNAVCLFLQENWNEMKNQKQDISKITRWPIFVALDGTCRRLASLKACILPEDLPGQEMDKWKSEGFLFLRENQLLKQLHQKLECKQMTKVDVLTNFILPAFPQFSAETRMVHLEHLKGMQLPMWKIKGDPSLMKLHKKLKDTRIVPPQFSDLENQLWKRACEYFCDKVEIFKQFYEEGYFMPEPYCSDEWQELMEAAGLTMQCDAAELLRMAESLAADQTADLDKISCKSEALLRYFQANLASEKAVQKQLAAISFIAPAVDNQLQQLCATYRSDDRLVSLNKCLLHSQRHLCWTAAPVAPRFIESLPEVYHLCKPKLTQKIFMNHFTNIFHSEPFTCSHNQDGANDSDRVLKLREKILNKVYRYLQENMEHLDLKEISQMPIVMVNSDNIWHFLPPHRVCFAESEQIPPFIVKCPSEFHSYKQLLVSLGATEVVSLQQIAFSLQQIAASSSALSEAAMQQVKHLMQLLAARLQEQCTFTPGMKLLMPTKDLLSDRTWVLCDCTELILNDAEGYSKRLSCDQLNGIRFLDLSCCELGTDKERLVQHCLHSQLQVPLLSQTVRECLQSDCNQQQCSDGDECQMKVRLNDRLHRSSSALFATSIIIHDQNQQLKSSDVFEKVNQLLTGCSVECVPALRTVLKLNDQEVSSSHEEQLFFLNQQQIVMSHASIPEGDAGGDASEIWRSRFRECVITLLDGEFCLTQKQLSLFQAVLPLSEDATIAKELTRRNVTLYDSGTDSIVELTANSDADIGSPLAFGDQSRMQLMPSGDDWHRIQCGTTVAIKSEAGQYVLAQVLRVHRSDSSAEGVQWSWHFTVLVGDDEEETVEAARVFPLQASASSTDPEAEEMSNEQLQQRLQQLLEWTKSLPGDQRDAVVARLLVQSGDEFDSINSTARSLGWQPHAQFNEETVRREARARHQLRRINRSQRRVQPRFMANTTSARVARVHPDHLVNARLFMRTSSSDLDIARDVMDGNQGFNWTCYLCLQSIEKSLVAAVHASGVNPIREQALTANLMQLTNTQLVQNLTAEILKVTEIITTDCRYPTANQQQTPSENYSKDHAEQAVSCAAVVLAYVNQFVASLSEGDVVSDGE